MIATLRSFALLARPRLVRPVFLTRAQTKSVVCALARPDRALRSTDACSAGRRIALGSPLSTSSLGDEKRVSSLVLRSSARDSGYAT
jgi:hypothetical protein